MFLCSLIEELCRKEESDKTGCNFNFGHECTLYIYINICIKKRKGTDMPDTWCSFVAFYVLDFKKYSNKC